MCFLKKIEPEYTVSFCLLHLELDKKRELSLHQNVANSIKLSEMIVRLIKNHFLWLV